MPKVGELRAGDMKQKARPIVMKDRPAVDLDAIYRIPTFAEVKAAGLAWRTRENDLPF